MLYTGEWRITHVCAYVFVCAHTLVYILAPEGVTPPPKIMLGGQELVSSSISSKNPMYSISFCLPT